MAAPPDAIRTERLLLRRWRQADLPPFRRMNADPEVMRFFAKPLSAQESDAAARRLMGFLDSAGIAPWAVEVPGEAAFIGFVGCWPTRPELPFAPAIEVGWRLDRPASGRGYATEAAEAALADAFDRLGLPDVVAYTAATNEPSRRVMDRLGMGESPGEAFLHPHVPADSPLQPHVLYRLTAEAFRERRLRRQWRDLVERRLPEAAALHPDWPVRLDHCFARILLDHACGGPWRETVAPPAWSKAQPAVLGRALALGEAVLDGTADLAELDRRSLAWRGKRKGAA